MTAIASNDNAQPIVGRSMSIKRSGQGGSAKENEGGRGTGASGMTLSALARELSEAASRAASGRWADCHSFGAHAIALRQQITGDGYFANKAAHDAEVPDSSDPDRLERSIAATAFVNGRGANPFSGMTRDQLALIAYDDSGAFTVNERRAAWSEAQAQQQVWKRAINARALDEYNRTGKIVDVISEVLSHLESLPAIEQAQYPAAYLNGLRARLGGVDIRGGSCAPASLAELLMRWDDSKTDEVST